MRKIGIKKVVTLFLVLAMVILMMAGCGAGSTSNPATNAASSVPETKAAEPVVLDFFAYQHPNWPLNDDTPVLQEIAKKTGVKIHWIPGPDQNYNDKLNIVMVSGDLPDLMSMEVAQLNNYGSKGAFLDMGELAEKYAPNVKKFMTPEAIMAVLSSDRKYYGIPLDMGNQQSRTSWLVRKDWTAKLNIKAPDNLDEYVAMLRAFKDSDFDGNGKKDTIPLSMRSGSLNITTKALAPTFGLTSVDMNVQGMTPGKDGKLFFNCTSENFKVMLTWLNMLYKEGLLDKEYPTKSAKQWEEAISTNLVGSTLDFGSRGDSFTAALQKTDPNAEFYAIKPPIGPFGDRAVNSYNKYDGIVSTCVTKTCKNPEAAMKFLDYWFSDEGSVLTTIGVKGSSYTDIVDGKAVFVDEIKKDPTNMGIWAKYGFGQQMISLRGDCRFGDELFFGKYFLIAAKVNEGLYKELMPSYNFSKDENDKVTELVSQFSPVITEYIDKFITGATPMSEWDNFVAQVNKLGVPEYAQIVNDAAARRAADYEYVRSTFK